ncbi:glycosyltransferase family 4 protein [Shewanella violacea]|nr:glycosyltransferase family 1 protein [Shewanella violacea]
MHLLFSACGFDHGQSGISQYMQNVAIELLKLHHVTVLINNSDRKYWPIVHPRQEIVVLPKFLNHPMANMVYHTWLLPHWVKQQLKTTDFDALILPAANRRVLSHYPLPTIATIHDLSQCHIANKYDFLRMHYIRHLVPKFLQPRVSPYRPHLVAVSDNTRKDMERFLHIPACNISVLHNGYDKIQFNEQPPQDHAQRLKRLNLKANYLLYVSRIEHPGKNHIGLIQAYEKLPANIRHKHPLVFVGSAWSGAKLVFKRIADSPAADTIKVLGFVDSSDLPSLYHGAATTVMPSLYEGFGLPLVEAMACATPVTCSNRGAMPEVVGRAALCFDPENPSSIAQCLGKILTQPSLKQQLIQLGLERVKAFDWGFHANQLLSTLSSRHGKINT